MMEFSLRCLGVVVTATMLSSVASGADTITVGVIDTLTEEESLARIREGLQAGLNTEKWTVRVVSVLSADEVSGIERFRPDFVLGPADLEEQFRAAGTAVPFRVATRKVR